ncbi:hypothetical protein BDV93DRAFT_524703 [Ceratobasidium sp. AG-I]|nr:hypothetical protein BDV93DRAFT_524703 [Ceratobasidium sp. AG-I]
MGPRSLQLSLCFASLICLAAGLVFPTKSTSQLVLALDLDQPISERHWHTPPANDSVDSLIFFRLATLLQHWPNTRYPSGQSVVPGTIPIGTTLYHGSWGSELPPGGEWLAFDAEHSAWFTIGPEGRLFTFVATRPLRILYFDGSSAAKLSSGAMDTQELLLEGVVGNNTMRDEWRRFNGLCEWGRRARIDGYVRMEMSFEIMHCNLTDGLELVSSAHILPLQGEDVSDGISPLNTRPGNWRGALTTADALMFEVFQAGSWHNYSPGEVRVRLDAAKLVTLYDPALKSGVLSRRGLEKISHRGEGLSKEDVNTWRGWIQDVVQADTPAPSGVDWQALTTVIMDRYGLRLQLLQSMLQPDKVVLNATAAMQSVRGHLMLMLVTDLTLDTIPQNESSKTTPDLTWAKPIAAHCSSFLLSHLPQDRFTREERTLYRAVSGTQTEICRVLSLLWTEAYDSAPSGQFGKLLEGWRERVEGLMSWLDWPMWNKCRPECSLDTMCFIPTWPLGGRGDLSKIDWTPKCIPRGTIGW